MLLFESDQVEDDLGHGWCMCDLVMGCDCVFWCFDCDFEGKNKLVWRLKKVLLVPGGSCENLKEAGK